jgi:hypothetical protein
MFNSVSICKDSGGTECICVFGELDNGASGTARQSSSRSFALEASRKLPDTHPGLPPHCGHGHYCQHLVTLRAEAQMMLPVGSYAPCMTNWQFPARTALLPHRLRATLSYERLRLIGCLSTAVWLLRKDLAPHVDACFPEALPPDTKYSTTPMSILVRIRACKTAASQRDFEC